MPRNARRQHLNPQSQASKACRRCERNSEAANHLSNRISRGAIALLKCLFVFVILPLIVTLTKQSKSIPLIKLHCLIEAPRAVEPDALVPARSDKVFGSFVELLSDAFAAMDFGDVQAFDLRTKQWRGMVCPHVELNGSSYLCCLEIRILLFCAFRTNGNAAHNAPSPRPTTRHNETRISRHCHAEVALLFYGGNPKAMSILQRARACFAIATLGFKIYVLIYLIDVTCTDVLQVFTMANKSCRTFRRRVWSCVRFKRTVVSLTAGFRRRV